ncbi:MAG: hypothetical protein ACP5KN_02320 [Armatimonadota bacterium]
MSARHTCVHLVALALCATVSAAPQVRLIEDFEGEPPDLGAQAQVIEAAGNHVLRWAAPASGT